MKKFLNFMLVACLMFSGMMVLSACNDNPGFVGDVWDGTKTTVSAAVNNEITIETAEELAGFAEDVNNGTDYYGITIKLTQDLDLKNKLWTPIGKLIVNGSTSVLEESHLFKGTFDGGNRKIHNLKVESSTSQQKVQHDQTGVFAVGLFGAIKGTVKNVKVVNAEVTGNHFVAVIAGWGSRNTVVENCHVENAEVSCIYANDDESGDKAGAIMGATHGVINNCSVKNTAIDADRDAGQIVGCLIDTAASQEGNTVVNVTVTDNNINQTPNENIKNEPVGRIR